MSVASLDRVRSGDTSDPLSKLRAMVEQRPVLAPGFAAAMVRRDATLGDDWSDWAGAVITLANVNAGPGVLLTAFKMASAPIGRSPGRHVERLAASLHQAAQVCRKAGAPATRICLEAYRNLSPGPLQVDGSEAAWWRGMIKIAEAAPRCIATAASVSDRVLRGCGSSGFEQFIDAALRASSDGERREAFLGLQDPEARRVFDRLSGRDTFTTLQPRLQAFATALWGKTIPLREVPSSTDLSAARRATFASGLVFIPDVFDASDVRTASLYDAIVAHATAHLVFGGPRFDPGALKPVQVALVGLIEDARVEALAIRRFPGLLRLWSLFHRVEPTHLKTAPLLMARLARALLDRTYDDDDGIIVKGRTLFDAESDLSDPEMARRIGDVLGNDIGQMRIGFDAKKYVIEPIYRDDNLGLWTPTHSPNAESQPLEAPIDTMPERQEQDGGQTTPDPSSSTGGLRLVAPDDRGTPIARYPEWDRLAGLERPDWTTLRAVLPPTTATATLDEVLARYAGLSARVARLVRAARFGRPKRLRRQADGPELDLDAAIDAVKDLRTGIMPDGLIHQRKVLASRDLAVSILIDMSQSTSDLVPAAGMTILAIEQLAVAVLAAAMEALGDTFALRAFASEGRENIHLVAIKDFSAPFDGGARSRLAGLRSALSTRLGAAIRHAGAELAEVGSTRRIVIAMTDGAPSDIDVDDPDDLIEDARRATLKLRGQGIDVFGIVLDPTSRGAGASIFGRTDYMPVRRIEELPSRLASLYFRIAQR